MVKNHCPGRNREINQTEQDHVVAHMIKSSATNQVQFSYPVIELLVRIRSDQRMNFYFDMCAGFFSPLTYAWMEMAAAAVFRDRIWVVVEHHAYLRAYVKVQL